jgi:hypothetical protein
MLAPIFALVDSAVARVAHQPEQPAPLVLNWFKNSMEALEAAQQDGAVVVYRVMPDYSFERIG